MYAYTFIKSQLSTFSLTESTKEDSLNIFVKYNSDEFLIEL